MIVDCFAKTGLIYPLGLIIFIYGYVRIFSKKYEKRAAQNKWYLEHTAGIRSIFTRMKKDKQAGKDYKVFDCKECHQMIRVPKGKGKIKITCPKCGNSFIKKT
jgi:predicted SprT family Zn-dependent metalloprotease